VRLLAGVASGDRHGTRPQGRRAVDLQREVACGDVEALRTGLGGRLVVAGTTTAAEQQRCKQTAGVSHLHGSPPAPPCPGAREYRVSRRMYYDDDADLTLLDGKTVAIIGFGSQGHAHALNLKDSGVDVVVGLRESSSSADQAREGGLEVMPVADAASRGDIVMVLVPDELHHDVYENDVRDGIADGNTLLFGHGFSV